MTDRETRVKRLRAVYVTLDGLAEQEPKENFRILRRAQEIVSRHLVEEQGVEDGG